MRTLAMIFGGILAIASVAGLVLVSLLALGFVAAVGYVIGSLFGLGFLGAILAPLTVVFLVGGSFS